MATVKADNLKAGLAIPFLTKRVALTEGEYTRGMIVELSGDKVKKAETGIYGIMAEDVKATQGSMGTVYIQGIFNKKAFSAEDVKKFEEEARKLNIIFE